MKLLTLLFSFLISIGFTQNLKPYQSISLSDQNFNIGKIHNVNDSIVILDSDFGLITWYNKITREIINQSEPMFEIGQGVFSKEENLFYFAQIDSIFIYNASNGQLKQTVPNPNEKNFRAVAYNNQLNTCYFGDDGGWLYSFKNGKIISNKKHNVGIWSLHLSTDASTLIIGGYWDLIILNLKTGNSKLIKDPIYALGSGNIAINPNDNSFFSGDYEMSIGHYSKEGKLIETYSYPNKLWKVTCDDEYLFAGTDENEIVKWKIGNKIPLKTFKNISSAVHTKTIEIPKENIRIVRNVSSEYGFLSSIDLMSFNQKTLMEDSSSIRRLEISTDKHGSLMTLNYNENLKLWSPKNFKSPKKKITSWQLTGPEFSEPDNVLDFHFKPSTNDIVKKSNYGTQWVNYKKGKKSIQPVSGTLNNPLPFGSTFYEVEYTADGVYYMVLVNTNYEGCKYNLTLKKGPLNTLDEEDTQLLISDSNSFLHQLRVNNLSSHVSCVSDSSEFKVFNLKTKQEVFSKLLPEKITSSYLFNEIAIIGTQKGSLYIIDIPTKRVRSKSLLETAITNCAAGQNRIILGTSKKLYFLNFNLNNVSTPFNHKNSFINDIQLNKDGSTLYFAGGDIDEFKLRYKNPTIEKVEKTFIDAITNVSIQDGKLVAGTIFGNVYIYNLKDFK